MPANISKLFTLGCVVTSAGQINQIVSQNISPGFETLLFNSDGQVDPRFAAIMSQRPVASFTTAAIVRALTVAGISGLAIAGSALDLWFHKYQQGGTRLTGSSSLKASFAYGLLCPRTLEVSDGAPAMLTYEVWARTNDGSTAPMSTTAAQAMPSITGADQIFTAGPVKVNGTTMEGVKRISIDFGLQLIAQGGSGCPFPEFIAIQQRVPTIRVRSTHLDFPTESGMGLYVPQNATNSLVYLRKVQKNASNTLRVPDGTAEHISASIDDGIVTIGELGADQESNEGAMIEAVFNPAHDGTNAIIALNLATAIA